MTTRNAPRRMIHRLSQFFCMLYNSRSFVMNDAILDPLESPLAQTDDNPDRVSEIVRRFYS